MRYERYRTQEVYPTRLWQSTVSVQYSQYRTAEFWRVRFKSMQGNHLRQNERCYKTQGQFGFWLNGTCWLGIP